MNPVERELLKFNEFRKTPEDYPPLALLFYALGLSFKELSEQLGLCRSQLSGYVTGRNYPSVRVAKRIQTIARYHGIAITLDEMFRDVDENEYETRGRKNREWYDEIKAEAGISERPIRGFEEVVRERGFSTVGEGLRGRTDEAEGEEDVNKQQEQDSDSEEPGDSLLRPFVIY